jgi:hypothetical protein
LSLSVALSFGLSLGATRVFIARHRRPPPARPRIPRSDPFLGPSYAACVSHDASTPRGLTGISEDLLRNFVQRPWEAVETAKREHIAARYREDPDAHVARVHALRDHMRLVRPEWPTDDDRARDLADHIALKAKIDRASRHLRDR